MKARPKFFLFDLRQMLRFAIPATKPIWSLAAHHYRMMMAWILVPSGWITRTLCYVVWERPSKWGGLWLGYGCA